MIARMLRALRRELEIRRLRRELDALASRVDPRPPTRRTREALLARMLGLALLLLAAPARADQLVDDVIDAYPRAGAAVDANVAAARAAASAEVDAELLLAIARVESGYRPTSVSRLVGGRRATGPWPSTRRPPGARGTFYCGVTQAAGPTWARCLELRDLGESYRATVAELGYWRGRCARRRYPWHCALAGYGAGNTGAARGTSSYARRVIRLARELGWK